MLSCRSLGEGPRTKGHSCYLRGPREATSLMISNFVAVLYDLWSRGKLDQTIKVQKNL